jgi:hypothetical protein
MSLGVWGVATQLCPQLPPQSGISYVSDYIDLIVDEYFFLYQWQGRLACLSGQPASLNALGSSFSITHKLGFFILLYYYLIVII